VKFGTASSSRMQVLDLRSLASEAAPSTGSRSTDRRCVLQGRAESKIKNRKSKNPPTLPRSPRLDASGLSPIRQLCSPSQSDHRPVSYPDSPRNTRGPEPCTPSRPVFDFRFWIFDCR
jgi:hypothetical protein